MTLDRRSPRPWWLPRILFIDIRILLGRFL